MREYYDRQAADLARYRRDTRDHRMTILHDDGDVFRHIRMAKPGTSNQHFNITTTPGYLTFTGDMGAYVFSRTRDMLKFHNIDWDRPTPTIDYRYWAEKCEAAYKCGWDSDGVTEFDEGRWRSAAVHAFREHEFPEGERMHLWADFRADVLDGCPQDEGEGLRAVMGWTYHDWDVGREITPFEDFWDAAPFRKHTFRFKWACWAIADTARQYFLGGDRVTRQAAHDREILRVPA